MRKSNTFLYLALALAGLSTRAQESKIYTHNKTLFDKAVNLYNEELYAQAEVLFNKVKTSYYSEEIQGDCAYYLAQCALVLEHKNAQDKLQRFIDNYPTNSKHAYAYSVVCDYYFKKGDFKKVLEFSEKAPLSVLSEKAKNKLIFQKAYANFQLKNYATAQTLFSQIQTQKLYKEQASYYLGYMAYLKNDYSQANTLFNKVADKVKYADKMGYYQADMNFKMGNHQAAIELAKKQFPKATTQEKSELSKIIGESYFIQGNYAQAENYLKQYQGKNNRWNNTDFYQLGYAYYKQNKYEAAVKEFNKIIDGNDEVAQNAYYHLGNTYLQLHEKTSALNAFKNASEMSFNKKIQEDAYYNYAKLSYQIGNPYQSVLDVLTNYQKKHPQAAHQEEINTLTVDAYLSLKNYQKALELLNSDDNFQNLQLYQKVSFYRALELFSQKNFTAAKSLFELSLKQKSDRYYTAKATYWLAETNYALNDYALAYQQFSTFKNLSKANETPEYKGIFYQLGYAAFKEKKWIEASLHFQDFINHPTDNYKKEDAYLRLADANFALAKYWLAIENYNKVLQNNSSASQHAHFQKALAYGILNKKDRKVEELEKFLTTYKESSYRDDAYYELGATFADNGQTEKALIYFDKLESQYPSSPLLAKAKLRSAQAHYNNKDYDKAIAIYKEVAKDYPGTSQGIKAVEYAQLAYKESGKTDELVSWLKEIDYVQIPDQELEKGAIEYAEEQALQKEYKKAIKGYNQYLKTFPRGEFALRAQFEQAELYYLNTKEFNKAKNGYKQVVAKVQNEYTEKALLRLSEIYLKEKDNQNAIETLKTLENKAEHPQHRIYAQSVLLNMYTDAANTSNALNYAEKILEHKAASDELVSKAKLIIARDAFNNNNLNKAKTLYKELSKSKVNKVAAEAIYHQAYFLNQEKEYKKSNKIIEKLTKEFSEHKEIGAKALVVMADNFYHLKDSYQATFILENVISNFGNYPEIKAQAQKDLAEIKKQEAKRNASVK